MTSPLTFHSVADLLEFLWKPAEMGLVSGLAYGGEIKGKSENTCKINCPRKCVELYDWGISTNWYRVQIRMTSSSTLTQPVRIQKSSETSY